MPKHNNLNAHRSAVNARTVRGETVRIITRLEKGNRALLKRAQRAGIIERIPRRHSGLRGIFSLRDHYSVPVSIPTRKTNKETRRVTRQTKDGVMSIKGTARERNSPKGKGEAVTIGYRYAESDLGGNQFNGGLERRLAIAEERRVRQIRNIFSKGARTDPVLLQSRNRFGLTEPPTFHFVAIFKPEQTVLEFRKGYEGNGKEYARVVRLLGPKERAEFDRELTKAEPGETIIIRAKRGLELTKIPVSMRNSHRLFMDKSLSERRIFDYPKLFTSRGKPLASSGPDFRFWRDRFSDFGFGLEVRQGKYVVTKLGGRQERPRKVSFEEATMEIMEKFSAGLANGIRICHDKLNSAYTMPSQAGKEHLYPGSSLQLRDVSLGNKFSGAEIHDLETIKDNPPNLRELQAGDLDLVRDNIRFLAKLMGEGERTTGTGEARIAFTSQKSKKLYKQGSRVFQELLSLGR